MKKIIVISFVLFVTNLKGQYKIGNLTIPDSIAKEYLFDLYNHPDTVKLKNLYNELEPSRIYVSRTQYTETWKTDEVKAAIITKEVKEFNDAIVNNSIKDVPVLIHHAYIEDTVFNRMTHDSVGYSKVLIFTDESMDVYTKQRDKALIFDRASGIKSITKHEAWVEYFYNKNIFLIARKPSEIDFINYINRRK
jgi:hypothetical protein